MALCLATSLIERKGFDPIDQLERYVRWWRKGYLSSTGICFDIGSTVRSALTHFMQTRASNPGSTDPRTAGNSSLMRLAPVMLYYARQPQQAIQFAVESSRATHSAIEAVDACRYFAVLILSALNGVGKEELLSDHVKIGDQYFAEEFMLLKLSWGCSGTPALPGFAWSHNEGSMMSVSEIGFERY
jgi:ADP-ribosyl-[dinitrogen reductase] hydrolase